MRDALLPATSCPQTMGNLAPKAKILLSLRPPARKRKKIAIKKSSAAASGFAKLITSYKVLEKRFNLRSAWPFLAKAGIAGLRATRITVITAP